MRKVILVIGIVVILFFVYQRYKIESKYTKLIFCADKIEYNKLKNKNSIVPIVSILEYSKNYKQCIIKFKDSEDFLNNHSILLNKNILAFYFYDIDIIKNIKEKNTIFKLMNKIALTIPNRVHFLSSEFSLQKYLKDIEYIFKNRLAKIHGLKLKEYSKINSSLLYNRYLRAYRERSVRFLKLAVFSDKEKNKYIFKIINVLKNNIDSNIIRIKDKFPIEKHKYYIIFFTILIFIIIITFIFKEITKIFYNKKYLILFLTFFIIANIYLLKYLSFESLLSLNLSIFYPIISIIIILKYDQFISPIIFGVIGGLSISILLGDKAHIVRLYSFKGVKLSFILPIIAIILYYIYSVKFKLSDIPNLKYFIIFFTIISAIYILRTGNSAKFLIFAPELKFRDLLENTFVIRPRFKEFLIGYPSLVIYYFYFNKLSKFLKLILVIFMSLIPITVINTFCHIHTPLKYSILRTFNGFILGIITGIIVVLFLKIIKKLSGVSNDSNV